MKTYATNKAKARKENMQTIKLTKEEDAMYNKFMGKYLNICDDVLVGEKETIRELKAMFPRLKKLLKKGVKIQ